MTRGFSLVELLVSLVILSLASVMLFAGIGGARGLDARLDRANAGIDTVEAAQNIIRAHVERAVPFTRYDATRPYSDFQGSRDTLFFLAPAVEARRPDAITAYRLSLSTGAELVLSTTSDLDPEDRPDRDDRVLLTGVAALELAYFGAAPPDGERRWREDWRDVPRPPELVRVRLAFEGGDRRRWPELLARPAATIDTGCVLNIATRKCKGR